jgi:hypothetical protein
MPTRGPTDGTRRPDPLPVEEVARRVLQLSLAQQRRAVPLVKQLYARTVHPLAAQGPVPTILALMEAADWFGPWFQGDTWAGWKAFLAAVFGLPMDPTAAAIYRQHTGRVTAPTQPTREGWVVAGVRAGKSRIAALIAVFLACFRDYRASLAPGERAVVMVMAGDRKQAHVIFDYVRAFLQIPPLHHLVVKETREAIRLKTRVVIEIHASSFRSVRGYTCAAVICDEIAFWPTDEGGANPDVEILKALRPRMVTIPGALLLCISSPYARRGALWEAYHKHHGQDGDPVLVWQAPTQAMNPTVDAQLIADAYAADEVAAAAEYGAEFRRDIESFVSREAVEAVVIPNRRELLPASGVHYVAFVDPSGGSQDSMTLAIAHQHKDGKAVLDCIRERRPPFNPSEVVADFAATLKTYRISSVTGDRYGGDWPPERFREHSIDYKPAEKTKSELYGELLPLVNGAQVELLDDAKLINQLCGLERRTARSGRDSIDHAPGGHEDVANCVAGALLAAAVPAYRFEYRSPSTDYETRFRRAAREGRLGLPEDDDAPPSGGWFGRMGRFGKGGW